MCQLLCQLLRYKNAQQDDPCLSGSTQKISTCFLEGILQQEHLTSNMNVHSFQPRNCVPKHRSHANIKDKSTHVQGW